MSVVGIDLGTYSSYIGVARAGGIETIANEYSDRMTPSYVSLGEKNRAVGVAAKQQAVTNFRNTVCGFKRALARKFNDPLVQTELQRSFKPNTVTKFGNGDVAFQLSYLGEKQEFSATQLTAMLLNKLKFTAEANLKTKVVDVVVSVPVFFTDVERRALLDACQMAGLNCLRILNDTTAAALSYGIYKSDLPAETEKPRNVVFVDFGYSSLQVSVCAFNKGKLKVLATAFDNQLGGRDLDALIVDHMCEEIKKKNKMDVKSNPKAYIRLTQECEKLKKLMSANVQPIPLNIECLMDDKDVHASMDRAQFEELAVPLLKRIETTLQGVLDYAKLKPSDIASVEIIGGSSRVPAFKTLVQQVFSKEPSTTLNADEAVARGCALQCAILSPTFRVRDFSITDCQPFPITLFWQPQGQLDEDSSLEVFTRFHAVPFSKMLTFYRKEPFTLTAFYSNRSDVPYPEADIGTFKIKNVVPQATTGESSKVKVKVRVTSHGVFTVVSANMYEKLEGAEEEEENKDSMELDDDVKKKENGTGDGAVNGEQSSSEMDQSSGSEPQKMEEGNDQAQDKAGDGNNGEGKDKKAPTKKTKTVKSIDLPIDTTVHQLPKDQLNLLMEKENQMVMQDRLEKERADAKNAVEEYVYEMRDKLYSTFENYITEDDRSSFSLKLEDTENWLYEDGEDQNKQVYLDKIAELKPQTDSTCTHPTIMKDMCAECGADLRREMGVAGDRQKSVSASVAMVHSIPELVISPEQAMEIGQDDENRLLRDRKLVLLVDLDQTLIHTTNDNIPPNLKDVKHFQLWHGKGYMWYHTRFRPHTRQFLESVSKMYELHICTFGVRMYAHIIARLMDPDKKYFSHRILSRDECFDALSKTANLKALFPCGDKMVAIIDDREDVWNHAPNLVHVKPYRFFQGTADINAPPGLTKAEHDNEPIAHKVVDHSHDTQEETGDTSKQETSADGSTVSSVTEVSAEGLSASGEETAQTEESGGEVNKSVTSDAELGVQAKEETDSQSNEPSSAGSGEKSSATQETTSAKKDSESQENVDSEFAANDKSGVSSTTSEVDSQSNSGDHREDKSNEKNGNGVDKKNDVSDKTDEIKRSEDEKKDADEEIEWDDEDDYLLHLEEILSRIHKAYYGMYEQSQRKGSKELPDLKNIIPYVRKKVLKGANIVFSGMFPLNMSAEKSRAYTVAKALGANIQKDIVPRKTKNGINMEATTHLVAAKPGTGKHKTALKTKGVHVVSGDWLWACNERWEWVEEGLFPLAAKDGPTKNSGAPEDPVSNPKKSKKRKGDEDVFAEEEDNTLDNDNDNRMDVRKKQRIEGPGDDLQPSTSKEDNPEKSTENFANSFNPLYSFSDEDIEFMETEVDEIMDEDGDSEESDEEREARIRHEVLKRTQESDSDSDSLSGDFPRGWKMRRKSFSPNSRGGGDEENERKSDAEDDDETENELERYNRNMAAFAPDDTEPDSSEGDDSIGSVDDEIAEAVEKEFLGSL